MHHRPWPDLGRVHDKVAALLAVVEEDLPQIRTNDGQKLMAAAALARCLRLLDGADVLIRNGRGEVAGGLVRSIFDALVNAVVALYGDEDDWNTMKGNYFWQVSRYTLINVEIPADQPKEKPNFGKLVQRAEALLKDGRANEANTIRDIYENMYRVESHMSIHGGWGAVIGYVDHNVQPSGLRLHRSEAGDASDLLAIGVELTGYLAQNVYDACGLQGDRLDTVADIDLLPRS